MPFDPSRFPDRVPRDVQAQETLRWLEQALPPPPRRVLEVGAGDGRVAAGLAALGYEVEALDRDAAAVADATTRHPRTTCGDFLAFAGGPFDVVLFTRSLHHLAPLGAAVERAHALLAPGGHVVAEEFAWERLDEHGADWLDGLFETFDVAGLLATPPERGGPPLARWTAHHRDRHGVHRGDAVAAAIGERFELLATDEAPYLWRSLAQALEPTGRGAVVAFQALEQERRRIAAGDVPAIGMRLVGRRGADPV
jgi:SAM-dependent methyltransferase